MVFQPPAQLLLIPTSRDTRAFRSMCADYPKESTSTLSASTLHLEHPHVAALADVRLARVP